MKLRTLTALVAALCVSASFVATPEAQRGGRAGGAPAGGRGGRGGPPPEVRLDTIRMPPGFAVASP